MYTKIKELINSKNNIFITGAAGTGKSYILNQLQQDYNDLVVTASTGVAAINVKGFTIHSFSGIGYGTKTAEQTAYSMSQKQKNRIIYCTRLAIDEISMLSAETFDLINDVFKIVRRNDLPFGGIQLIVVGDFLQLPPVSKNREVKFAFESDSWKEAKFNIIHLEKQYRQEDAAFLAELNKIRLGENVDMNNTNDNSEAIHLFPLNNPADTYNKKKLAEIKNKLHHFEADDQGNEFSIEKLDKDCLVPKNLYLKIGARVMLLINKYIDMGLINGSIGTVTEIYDSIVTIKFDNGITQNVTYEPVAKIVDRNSKLKEEVVLASRSQIPLRLAYAISVHKAQGLTLNKAYIDFAGTFECGQVYVALSRVRSKEGLSVKNLNHNMIKANQKAVQFYKELK